MSNKENRTKNIFPEPPNDADVLEIRSTRASNDVNPGMNAAANVLDLENRDSKWSMRGSETWIELYLAEKSKVTGMDVILGESTDFDVHDDKDDNIMKFHGNKGNNRFLFLPEKEPETTKLKLIHKVNSDFIIHGISVFGETETEKKGRESKASKSEKKSSTASEDKNTETENKTSKLNRDSSVPPSPGLISDNPFSEETGSYGTSTKKK